MTDKEQQSKIIDKMHRLVGLRDTEEEIQNTIEKLTGREISMSRAEEDTSLDLCYVVAAGMVGDNYMDFDVFVLETRQKGVFYVTEVTFIG